MGPPRWAILKTYSRRQPEGRDERYRSSGAILVALLPGEDCGRLLFSADVSGPEGARSMSAVQEITDANFETEVINSDLPVLIDFWAPWCAPCRAIGPVVDELSREFTGKLKVVKMNVDDNPLTPSRFGVRSIPNLLIF